MSVVLDTDTVIYFFKGKGAVAQRLLATPPAEVSITAISLFELQLGVAKSGSPDRLRTQLDTLLRVVRVLPFGEEEAQVAAQVRARLEALGTPIGPLDTLIAGTALRHGATLVTRNLREFRRVEGLFVDDWYGPNPD